MTRFALPHWLFAGGLVCLLALHAAAQPSTDASASLLVFPLIAADGTHDTVIQITNASRNTRHARCFYEPPNPTLETVRNFDIFLTPRQPTHWAVSRGRAFDPSDAPCKPGTLTATAPVTIRVTCRPPRPAFAAKHCASRSMPPAFPCPEMP